MAAAPHTMTLPRLILRSYQSLLRRGCLAWHPHPHRASFPTISTTTPSPGSRDPFSQRNIRLCGLSLAQRRMHTPPPASIPQPNRYCIARPIYPHPNASNPKASRCPTTACTRGGPADRHRSFYPPRASRGPRGGFLGASLLPSRRAFRALAYRFCPGCGLRTRS